MATRNKELWEAYLAGYKAGDDFALNRPVKTKAYYQRVRVLFAEWMRSRA